MTTNDKALAELTSLVSKVRFKPLFDQHHGGCPPAYRGSEVLGVKDVSKEILAWHRTQVIKELEECFDVPVGEDKYEDALLTRRRVWKKIQALKETS